MKIWYKSPGQRRGFFKFEIRVEVV